LKFEGVREAIAYFQSI